MEKKLLRIFWFISIIFLTGCAASSSLKQEPIVINEPKVDNAKLLYRNQLWDENKGVQLECKAANRLGCRHRGNIYPWGAWVELKGYNSSNFEVVEVVQTGSQAQVMVVER